MNQKTLGTVFLYIKNEFEEKKKQIEKDILLVNKNKKIKKKQQKKQPRSCLNNKELLTLYFAHNCMTIKNVIE